MWRFLSNRSFLSHPAGYHLERFTDRVRQAMGDARLRRFNRRDWRDFIVSGHSAAYLYGSTPGKLLVNGQ
jgi:hypothetical protein